MLRESEGYLSGQQLCEQLGVSRTAVWKTIGQLKEEGYQIQAVRNKGYRLVKGADVITRAELVSSLDSAWAGHQTWSYYDSTDSTNTRARQLAEKARPTGPWWWRIARPPERAAVAVTGRRRMGTGIWMTLILRPELEPQRASMLTLVTALAVADAIRGLTGLEAAIKWPNDIVCGGKKVVRDPDGNEHGGGADPLRDRGHRDQCEYGWISRELGKTATSLKLELGRGVKRSPLVAAVMNAFEKYYALFEKAGDLSGLVDTYNRWSANTGRQVRVLDPAGEYQGEALGYRQPGGLSW